MAAVQELIHELEVGGGKRWLRTALGVVAILLLISCYDWLAFKNMSTQEAMDAAQLGRNIAQGKGYTTLFVRPLSFVLIKTHSLAKNTNQGDPGRLKGMHPDIANPPVYPLVLAGLMKVLPFHYSPPATKRTETPSERYQPDFLIALFNQVLLLALAVMVFLFARRLFDRTVASYSVILLLGTELFWRFSVSGLSTTLLLVIFLGLAWCLVRFEEEARESRHGQAALLAWAVLAGVLTGLGGLTRYAFGWLIVPVLLFVILFGGRRRLVPALVVFAAFACFIAPWVVRNWGVSGTAFGTAAYALLVTPRSLESALPHFTPGVLFALFYRLLFNLQQVVETDLPKLGGTWLSAFFLVGLMVGFRSASVRRLRYFLVASLVVLAMVQAVCHNPLSENTTELDSENLLVLVAPLVLVYGVSLFFMLLDQLHLPIRELRHLIVAGSVLLACLPLILVLSLHWRRPALRSPISPPYSPAGIRADAYWAEPGELTMSDIPWAVAWYGRAQCMWLTLNAASDFLAINDYQKPVSVLYLSEDILNARFLTLWYLPGEMGWGNLMFAAMEAGKGSHWPKRLDLVLRGPMDESFRFPLHYWQPGWPYQFLLTSRQQPAKSP